MQPVTQPPPSQPQPKAEVAPPVAVRNGKVLSLLIALEALRQQPYALSAHKV